MNENINKIIEDYKNGEKTPEALEETNAALKAAGASFHLDPDKNPDGGWTAEEMASGFLPGDPAAPKPDKADLSRVTALAGQTVVQETKAGRFAVSYDEMGYAVKALRL